MKINFDTILNKLDGTPLQRPDKGDSSKDLTLGYVAVEALMAFDPQTRVSGAEKVRCANLAAAIYQGGELEVTAEDIVLLKDKVGEAFAPIVVGQAWALLEQKVIGEK